MPSSMSLEKELAFIDIGDACFAIPKFRGEKEEFTGWLSKVERVFACCILNDQQKFKVVISRLRGCALQWWNDYKFKRKKKGKERVRTWRKLSSKLKGSFCPSTYTPIQESISLKPTGSFPSTPQKKPTPQMIFPPPLSRCLKCHGLGHLATDCPNNKVITLEERKAVREEEKVEEKEDEHDHTLEETQEEVMEVELEEESREKTGEFFEEVVVEADKGEVLSLDTHHPPRSYEHLSLPTTFYESQAHSSIPPTPKALTKLLSKASEAITYSS